MGLSEKSVGARCCDPLHWNLGIRISRKETEKTNNRYQTEAMIVLDDIVDKKHP